MKAIRTAEKIINDHFEATEHIEEIMETLEDHGLLNKQGKQVRHLIRQYTTQGVEPVITEEDTRDTADIKRRIAHMNKARESFSEYSKNILIKSAQEGRMNKFAREFIFNKISG